MCLSKCIAVRRNSGTLLRETDMPYGITQLPPEKGENPPLPPAEAGTRFSDPRGMEG